jgi:predicted DCC family thiol-disulfide oxidoreductase YuxK
MNPTEEKNLSASQNIPADKFLVVFDGMCNLCNRFVNFLIHHDKHNRFVFAALQTMEKLPLDSEIRKNILSADSVTVIADGKIYFRSDGILKVINKIGGGWKLFYLFIIIPKPIRDWVYDVIAKNRYRWFGRTDSCMVPDEKTKRKFIAW